LGGAKTQHDVERDFLRRCTAVFAQLVAGRIVERISLQIFVFLGRRHMTRLVINKLTVLLALISGWIITVSVLIANQI